MPQEATAWRKWADQARGRRDADGIAGLCEGQKRETSGFDQFIDGHRM